MIVADAGLVVAALAESGERGSAARRRLAGEDLVAPELLALDTLNVFRGLVRSELLSPDAAVRATRALTGLPIRWARHVPLLARCWQLRDNSTSYDASYVALAELLDIALVTTDARLSRAPGLRCAVEVVA